VREHHAELAGLLEQLKPQNPAKYQAAMVDLNRDLKRLEQVRKRSASEAYEYELSLWKSRSRVRLLAARLSMADDAALREELKSALRDLRQQELASVEREITGAKSMLEKQQQKLDKLERQQKKLASPEEQWIDQQLQMLEKAQQSGANKPVKADKPKSKPAKESKAAAN
jgi:predicted phage tail protein